MGFNISGLVINKNYKGDFDQLQKEFGWTLKKEGEINFETPSSNWKDDGICDVYFSKKGTLLFIRRKRLRSGYWKFTHGVKQPDTTSTPGLIKHDA